MVYARTMVWHKAKEKSCETRIDEESVGESPISGHPPVTVAFNDVCLSQDGKPILKDVFGKAGPGEILAVMGPSGSGKTTLANAIFGDISIDKGFITLNGERLNKDVRHHMAYARQTDIFFSNLTLEYTLMFYALMRLPFSMSYPENINHMRNMALSFNLDNPQLLKTLEQLYTENRSRLIEDARKRLEDTSNANDNSTIPALDMEVLVDQGNTITNELLKTQDMSNESSQDSGRSSMFSSTGNSSLSASDENILDFKKWPIPFWEQVKLLTKRNFLVDGSRSLTKLNMFHTIALMVLVCAMWWQIQRTEENLPSINGYLFFTSFFWYLTTIFECFSSFPEDRLVINRERASGMYRLSA